jgi:Ca2+-binding EF-hand superfamily protein
MDLEAFVTAYSYSIERRSSSMVRQLEKAFAAFDTQGTGVLPLADMRSLLKRMACAPLDERRLDDVLAELAGHADDLADGMITINSFSRWMMSTYKRFLKDPSLVADSKARWSDMTYNQ